MNFFQLFDYIECQKVWNKFHCYDINNFSIVSISIKMNKLYVCIS